MKTKLKKLKDQNQGFIDSHSHSGVSLFAFYHGFYPCIQSLEDLVSKSRKNEIDWLISTPMSDFYFSLPAMFKQGQLTESGLQKFPFEIANRYFLSEVSMWGEGVLPFLMIHPTFKIKEQCQQIEQWANEYEIFGLKLPINGMGCTAVDLNFSPFVEILRDFNWPILIHCGNDDQSHPKNILKFSEKNPDIKVCAAHGARFCKDFWREIEFDCQIYVDTSPFLLLCEDTLNREKDGLLNLDFSSSEKVIEEMFQRLPDRLLWGTDEPFTKISRGAWSKEIEGGTNYKEEVRFFKNLNPDIKSKIAWKNTKEYLGIN